MSNRVYRRWDDIPQYFRENVMKVISSNKINFNNLLISREQTGIFGCKESYDNGRLVYNDHTCMNIYRLPDINDIQIYSAIDYNYGGSITIYFCNKIVERASYISIIGGVIR